MRAFLATTVFGVGLTAAPAVHGSEPPPQCGDDSEYLFEWGPSAGGEPIPTNARFWAPEGVDSDGAMLTSTGGIEIPLVRTHLAEDWVAMGDAGRGVDVFTPDEPLTPGDRVHLRLDWGYPGFDADWDVGDAPDEVPPDVPIPEDLQIATDYSIHGSARTYDWLVDVDGGGGAILWVGILRGDDRLDVGGIFGDVAALSEASYVTFGKDRCGANVPELQLGETREVLVGAFDVAGNFSGWSEPVSLSLDELDGCYCLASVAASPGGGAAAAASVALAILRRRRAGPASR